MGGADMNRILTFTFAALMLSAPAFPDTVPSGASVLPQRPAGKPEAVRCDRTVATHIRDLHCTSNAERILDTVPEGVTLRAYQPVGNGDPNAISCWAYRTTPPIR